MNGINLVHLCTNKKGKIEVDDELLETMPPIHAAFIDAGSGPIFLLYEASI